MINKRTIFFMIFTIFTIDAMEVEKEEKVCHLALLPAEIHNHIALYLPFNTIESDDKFIQRTREYGTVSNAHTELIQSKSISFYSLKR